MRISNKSNNILIKNISNITNFHLAFTKQANLSDKANLYNQAIALYEKTAAGLTLYTLL
jgi:hypothetical protein